MTRLQKILIGFFLLTALGIRILAALLDHTTVLRGDASGYDEMAMSLALGKGYRFDAGEGELTASRVPLYPLFLAGIYRVAGHNYRAVRMVQALLSTLTVLGIALWAHCLFGGRSACFAAFIASIYPAFYAYYFSSTTLMTETLYVFLYTASLFTLYACLTRPSWPLAVVSGLFWGLTNLTRPLVLPLIFFLPFILIFLRYPSRRVLRYTGMVWLTVALVTAPWMIRNYLVLHHPAPLSTNIGLNFYTAFHPEEQEGFGYDAFHKFYLPEEKRLKSLGVPESEMAGHFFREGLRFIRDYPGHTFRLFLKRVFFYMDPHTTLYQGEGKIRIVTWEYLFVLTGAIVGFFLSLRRRKYRREIMSLWLIFGYFVLFHGFLVSAERYRFPNEPILIVLTSFALSFLPKLRIRPCNDK